MARETHHYDWVGIEQEYRAGQLSVREIERRYGIDHSYLIREAQKRGWVRDLAGRVREKMAERLIPVRVSGQGEDALVEAAAERGAEIVRSHRDDIRKARAMARLLGEQLREAASHRDDIEADIKGISREKRARIRRAISLQAHASILRDLAVVLRQLIPLERRAYDLDETAPDRDIKIAVVYER